MPKAALCVVLFLILSGVPTAVFASTLTSEVLFQTAGQSMWGPGAAQTFNYSRTLVGTDFNIGGKIGGVKKTFFGRFGAELEARVSGNVGLGFESHFTSGDVSVDLPVRYTLSLPDSHTVRPGETFQIASGFELLGGELQTASPQGGWGLYLNADVNASFGGRACVFGCVSGGASKNFGIHQRLVGVDQNSRDLSITGPAGLHAGLGFPVVNTSGGLVGGRLVSEGGAQFASMGWNFTDFIQQMTGIPIKGSLSIGIGSVGYKLLDIDLGASLRANQDFAFLPIPMIDLAVSTGDRLLFPAGSSVEFTMPDSGAPIEFTPTYFLANLFTSRTSMELGAYLDLAALEASAKLLRFNVGRIGPLFHKNWNLSLGEWTVHERAWELQGFNVATGETYSLTPTPEPTTFLLIGVGLLVLGLVRRRRANLA